MADNTNTDNSGDNSNQTLNPPAPENRAGNDRSPAPTDTSAVPPRPASDPISSPNSGTNLANPLVPTDDEAALAAADIAANKVATPGVVANVLRALQQMNSNANAADLFALAWACYHNGSSRYTTLTGSSPHGIALAEIKDQVENHCTLRQFCMYYAKICYNTGRSLKKPPANWMAKGFKEDTKYAAFDFFAGVLNDASPKPKGGMRFSPTAAEIQAHAVNSTMAIIESREPGHQVSNRGNMLAMQQVRAPQAPPMVTFE